MKTSELMIGDWVLDTRTGTPLRVNPFMAEFEVPEWQPIPLTVEILEKNGFIKGDTMDLGDEIYSVKLFNIHYDNEEREFWVCNFFESEYGTEINDIFRIKYVHELRHALRLCKVDKEIVV